jgi:hypothetical protein
VKVEGLGAIGDETRLSGSAEAIEAHAEEALLEPHSVALVLAVLPRNFRVFERCNVEIDDLVVDHSKCSAATHASSAGSPRPPV